MKDLYCGDLHGNLYAFEKAIDQFEKGNYNKLIFIGDYVDSFDYTDVEMVHLLSQLIEYKKSNFNKVECLLGNHDWQYYYLYNHEFRCSGFRNNIAQQLYKMFQDNKDLFKIAYKKGKCLATHAGISNKWYNRYYDRLLYYAEKHLDIKGDFDIILNSIKDSNDNWILSTVGSKRGGWGTGGPLWADKSEMSKYESCKIWKQIVGHTPIGKEFITVEDVIFIDCLRDNIKFLTIDYE